MLYFRKQKNIWQPIEWGIFRKSVSNITCSNTIYIATYRRWRSVGYSPSLLPTFICCCMVLFVVTSSQPDLNRDLWLSRLCRCCCFELVPCWRPRVSGLRPRFHHALHRCTRGRAPERHPAFSADRPQPLSGACDSPALSAGKHQLPSCGISWFLWRCYELMLMQIECGDVSCMYSICINKQCI